ncbi:hypothetical protein SAMN05444008_101349 [Cnuella takakiae]|uniref:Uncharacterized protein n=1 Tax=Cnuella takakiae TaxID=1302690 RepID=A0A1M4T6Y5_9BACT|nr:hypothetical protein [Cnuella takakiae]OLY90687.1 hypothetical protein BUE76_01315 [Cnuella takakiae]SHE40221.1 hypothetical protein SAMN05444008_101349 [Cnuella takakiae]
MRTLHPRKVNKYIRASLREAVIAEQYNGPFNLSGRGHEPRVSLDRRMAGVLKNEDLPVVVIAGYGANNFFPKRIFDRALHSLIRHLGYAPFACANNHSVYRLDDPKPGDPPRKLIVQPEEALAVSFYEVEIYSSDSMNMVSSGETICTLSKENEVYSLELACYSSDFGGKGVQLWERVKDIWGPYSLIRQMEKLDRDYNLDMDWFRILALVADDDPELESAMQKAVFGED